MMGIDNTSPPLHEIRDTPYGGRGAFAVADIPKETLILSCSSPYASVILRKFRKEVCNWCYAYSFEKGKNKWDVKLADGTNKTNVGTPAFFCSEDCLKTWVEDYRGANGAGVWSQLCMALERTYLQESASLANTKQPPKITAQAESLISRLDDLSEPSGVISNEVVTDLWHLAEEVFSMPKAILPTLRHWGIQLEEFLTEFELDAARFIFDGLFRRSLEDLTPDAPVENIYNRRVTGLGSWQDLLKLQDMETNTIRTHPTMLASFIRVWAFLKYLIGSTKTCPSPSILDRLRRHISNPATTRALIARDHSNVFGIWEQADNEGESEMLGWGMFVSASFFNHDCSPNLKKRAAGRAIQFYTIRDVQKGEELCTNYIDVSEGNPVASRTAQLEKGWYFTCFCKRCSRERETSSDTAGRTDHPSPGHEGDW